MFKQIIPYQNTAKSSNEEEEDLFAFMDTVKIAVNMFKWPVSKIPKHLRICEMCNNVGEKYLKCAGCKSAHYCSRECQQKGHKTHKAVCGYLARDDMPLDPVHVMCLKASILKKVNEEDFNKSAIYTSACKYWRIIVNDWDSYDMLLMSSSKDEVDSKFKRDLATDTKSDFIFYYSENGRGMKLNLGDAAGGSQKAFC